MNAKDVYDILCKFIENDFMHLKRRVDWIFYSIITLLLGTIGSLLLLILKK